MAGGAKAAENDPRARGLKTVEITDLQLLDVVDIHIVQFATAIALRVVMLGHIGIEPRRATSGLHHLQFAHRCQIVQRLVNGAQ